MIQTEPAEPQFMQQTPSADRSAAIAISVRDVGKMYRIYDQPQDRLKQMLLHRFGRSYGHEFWALRGVSFEVRRGEAVGIIGRNGSGKSTLLQMIAGILSPTEGEVVVNGRVAALLELGSGFNPEFTGRENVFLNGSIFGMSHEHIEQRFDDIAAFADIGEFLDQPVKTYSSGMIVRLAFAVQAHLEPETLIVDEALAVGDMYFQAKCMAKIDELRKRGTSILFVSHAIDAIRALCTRAVLLDRGTLVIDAHPDVVTDRYVSIVMGSQSPHDSNIITQATEVASSATQPPFEQRVTERFGLGLARYVECRVYQNGQETEVVYHGSRCEIRAWLQYDQAIIDSGELGIVVRTLDGIDLFAANTFHMREAYPPQPRGAIVCVTFSFDVIMTPGIYTIVLGYRTPVQGDYQDKVFNAAVFRVESQDGRVIPYRFAIPWDFAFQRVDKSHDVVSVAT
jgi:lipopolysaccharide transport system ATP-binding protein